MDTLVEIDNVRKVYKRDAFDVPVLNGVTLAVPRGDFFRAQTLGKIASVLAHGEGLPAHARAAEMRFKS